jgi:hypothetical protein
MPSSMIPYNVTLLCAKHGSEHNEVPKIPKLTILFKAPPPLGIPINPTISTSMYDIYLVCNLFQ